MPSVGVVGRGTKEEPWVLKTPPGSSGFLMYRDEAADPPALVCQVGKTLLRYHLRAVEDLHAMLLERGDWVGGSGRGVSVRTAGYVTGHGFFAGIAAAVPTGAGAPSG